MKVKPGQIYTATMYGAHGHIVVTKIDKHNVKLFVIDKRPHHIIMRLDIFETWISNPILERNLKLLYTPKTNKRCPFCGSSVDTLRNIIKVKEHVNLLKELGFENFAIEVNQTAYVLQCSHCLWYAIGKTKQQARKIWNSLAN